MSQINININTLVNSKGAKIISGHESYFERVKNVPLCKHNYFDFKDQIKNIGVTEKFKQIVDYFKVPAGESPAGFKVKMDLEDNETLKIDLVRDISYDKNNQKRPTKLLFSADSANPYEIEPVKNYLANLTCNPGIIYDLFINNPKANVGNKYKTRDEVMAEIGRILGPGCDISVELNNPFSESKQEILEEAAKFKEMLSEHRVIIKVPHTGPVNSQNVNELLEGDKMFQRRYDAGTTKDKFHGHDLALMLHEHGYRVNFTLMFEPYQVNLALQARPAFINTFIRHRGHHSMFINKQLELFKASEDPKFLEELRAFFLKNDFISPAEKDMSLLQVKADGERILKYRNWHNPEGEDQLDDFKHSLRVLRNANLPDTRLIICSMEGELNYPAIDKVLAEPEFEDMVDRVVLTTEPAYLAKFTTTPQVISYQRRFMNAAKGQK